MAALLISRGCVLGSYYPFGLSLSAAISTKNFIPTLIGTLLGYLFPLRLGSSMRYISAVISIGAVRWALSDLEKIKSHALYTPAVVFTSSFVTGLAVNCAQGFDRYSVMITIFECLIAAAAGYFFDISLKLLISKKFYALDVKEFACVAISASIALLSLSGISIHGVSPGRILGIVMILVAAHSMGVIGGVLMGTASGVIFSLPSFGLSYISSSYGLAGMISGIFSSWGRLGICISFLCSYFLVSLRSGDAFQLVAGIYELIIGSGIFLLLPRSFFNSIKNSMPSFKFSRNLNFKEAIVQKLKLTSNFLSTVPECIDKTAADINALGFSGLEESCFDSVKSYCSGCGIRKFCWDHSCKSTYEGIRLMIKNISIDKSFEENIAQLGKLKYCKSSSEIANRIYSTKRDFAAHKLLKSKVVEFKKTISDHFEQMSSLLEYISDDFKIYSQVDEVISSKIESLLKKMGINFNFVRCKRGEEKRIFIDVETEASEKNKFNKLVFKEISLILGRKLDEPIMSLFDNICRIQFFEKRNYKVNLTVSQHAYNGGKFCGDNCRCFEDGEGRFNLVLSDGMGTGTEAALEATLVAELIKKLIRIGMSFNSAVGLVNSVLLLNSKEEAIATLDMISINLFNGKASFLKAGSPATFLLRGPEIKKINFTSLPIGILKEVSISQESMKLRPGDVIIMVSDGVTDIGEDWTLDLLKGTQGKPISEISKIIVSEAVNARKGLRDDDITAIALEIENLN